MSEFEIDGIRYQVIDASKRTLRVGNNSDIDSNAVVATKLKKRLHFIETYVIDSTVYHLEEISKNAFRNCNIINTVFIPDSVLYIRFRGFDCSSLRKIIFSPKSRLTHIDNGALLGTKITSLAISSTLVGCNGYCLSRSVLRNIYYCGNYSFTSTNLENNKFQINLHLSSNNALENLGQSIVITKSQQCTFPADVPYCTMKLQCRKTSSNLFMIELLCILSY